MATLTFLPKNACHTWAGFPGDSGCSRLGAWVDYASPPLPSMSPGLHANRTCRDSQACLNGSDLELTPSLSAFAASVRQAVHSWLDARSSPPKAEHASECWTDRTAGR